MKSVMNVWMFGLVCVSLLFTGCDYGPLEEGEQVAQYETIEGELKKGELRSESVGAWDYADMLPADVAAVPADCACTCAHGQISGGGEALLQGESGREGNRHVLRSPQVG